MPSSLAWLDHDAAAHERTKRILALFQERGTQDQLGLGGIRDSFADLFFPGTSTIQTRLRYFLFVPWIYTQLEEEEVPARHIAAEARAFELELIEPLQSAEKEGVFGSMAGGDLKRLPSEVYWGGLGSWGIRRFDASRGQYHRAIDDIYRRRHQAGPNSSEGAEPSRRTITWHPELPKAPESFPEQVTLSLRQEEAEFLRDRIAAEHPSSLLRWLAFRPVSADIGFPWEHPLLEHMPQEHLRALHHARLFSEVMAGAPILYNRMLSEEAGKDDLVERYRQLHSEWAESLDRDAVAEWPLDELFAIARGHGTHGISAQLEEFVRRWVVRVRQDPTSIPDSGEARKLIRNREMLLKGPRSLFRNRRALEERYNGDLGIGQLNYRWSNVRRLLEDLHAGAARS